MYLVAFMSVCVCVLRLFKSQILPFPVTELNLIVSLSLSSQIGGMLQSVGVLNKKANCTRFQTVKSDMPLHFLKFSFVTDMVKYITTSELFTNATMKNFLSRP